MRKVMWPALMLMLVACTCAPVAQAVDDMAPESPKIDKPKVGGAKKMTSTTSKQMQSGDGKEPNQITNNEEERKSKAREAWNLLEECSSLAISLNGKDAKPVKTLNQLEEKKCNRFGLTFPQLSECVSLFYRVRTIEKISQTMGQSLRMELMNLKCPELP